MSGLQIAKYHLKAHFQIPYSSFPLRGIQNMQYRFILALMAIFLSPYWMIRRFSGPALFRNRSLGPKLSIPFYLQVGVHGVKNFFSLFSHFYILVMPDYA